MATPRAWTTTGQYRAIPRLNWSTLRHWRTSPAHGHAYETTAEERPDTDDYRLGRAFHIATTEPEKFGDRYVVVSPKVLDEIAPPRNEKAGKAAWRSYQERHPGCGEMTSDEYRLALFAEAYPGREVLSEHQRDTALAMAEAVRRYAPARRFFEAPAPEIEVVREWVDADTQTLCKARLDLVPYPCDLVDLKSANAIELRPFQSKSWRLGYLHQLAFYRRGQAAHAKVSRDAVQCFLLACEKPARPTGYIDVGLFPIAPASLDYCDDEIDALLKLRAKCRAEGVYPGRYPEPVEIGAPAWAIEMNDDGRGFEIVETEE